MAALLEADLQAANATAEMAAARKERDDAEVVKCQQVKLPLLYQAHTLNQQGG